MVHEIDFWYGLETLTTGFLGSRNIRNMFKLCQTIFVPSLVLIGLKLWKQCEKKHYFIENRLATLVNVLLRNVGDLSVFVLCRIMFMPSLAQLGLSE